MWPKNPGLWPAIREYIAAEVNLNLCRHERMRHKLKPVEVRAWDEQIAKLEAQSSRMEAPVREMTNGDPNSAVSESAEQHSEKP